MTERKIQRLMIAIVQLRDVVRAVDALAKANLNAIYLSSSGGFLEQQNATLLVGLEEGQYEKAVDILGNNCQQRVEYMASLLEGAPFHLPLSTPINVGGATIFSLPVERYEVIR